MTTWNCIAFRGRCTDHLEEVLSDTHVVFLVTLLADHGVHDGLEDVFFWENTLHVFDKLVGLVHFFVLEVIDD